VRNKREKVTINVQEVLTRGENMAILSFVNMVKGELCPKGAEK
jgi:hypothetical protein